MSTTIQIIPVETSAITFGQVISTSERNINNFLNSIGLTNTIKLKVNVHEHNEKYVNTVQFEDKFEWNDNEYAWFAIEGVPGGTDGYCWQLNDEVIDPEDPWWIFEEIEANNKTIEDLKNKIEKSKLLNRRWSFRRSAGQYGIIAISYGLISAAIAELTNGILWADDGAWDFERFPAKSVDFLDWYFRPDKAIGADYASWARSCINGILDDFSSSTFGARDSPRNTSSIWDVSAIFVL